MSRPPLGRPTPAVSPPTAAAPICQGTAGGERITLIAIADLRLLPDGRVFALVTQDDPNRPPDGPEPVFLTFAKQGNRWLVDELQVLAAGAATS